MQHSDGQCEHTLRVLDSFLACCALSDLRFSFVTMSSAQVKTTIRVSPITFSVSLCLCLRVMLCVVLCCVVRGSVCGVVCGVCVLVAVVVVVVCVCGVVWHAENPRV